MSTKTEHSNCLKCRICGISVVLDCIHFVQMYQITQFLSVTARIKVICMVDIWVFFKNKDVFYAQPTGWSYVGEEWAAQVRHVWRIAAGSKQHRWPPELPGMWFIVIVYFNVIFFLPTQPIFSKWLSLPFPALLFCRNICLSSANKCWFEPGVC